jgi:hypothetical protein
MPLETLVQVQLVGIIPAKAGESGDTSKAEAPGCIRSLDLFIKETDLAALWDSMDGIQGFDVVSHEIQGKARGILIGLKFWVGERWHSCQSGDDEGFDEVHRARGQTRDGATDRLAVVSG